MPIWKRCLDLVICLIALLFAMPLMLVVAVYIKLVSKGPVIFRQERVGFKGGRFECQKFRSMKPDSDTSIHSEHVREIVEKGLPLYKLDQRGDERLIPLGWLIRACGVDELPQLLNVLKGEMSFVGPRPCLLTEYQYFKDSQRERFEVYPGVTGLWQITARNDTTFDRMAELDITYARNMTLLLDLKIIVLTIPALVSQVLRFYPRKADRTASY